MADDKPIGRDVSGFEVITEAVRSLLNQYPGLGTDIIRYEELEEDNGIAFSNDSGALVYSEVEDVIGMLHQKCRYPFFIVYRSSSSVRERTKISIQTFLDTFGKWLCKEEVTIDGQVYKLTEYPELSGTRKIKRIVRDNSYGIEPQDNGVQDWLLPVVIEYENEYMN